MTLVFLVLAAITILGMGAAMTMHNPVHCVVGLTVGLLGLATLYLQLGAQFVGLTQVLVYVGAVAILIIFAIMMTRSVESAGVQTFSRSWVTGVASAVTVFAVLGWTIHFGANALPHAGDRTRSAGEAGWRCPVASLCAAAGNYRRVAHRRTQSALVHARAPEDPAGEKRGPQ